MEEFRPHVDLLVLKLKPDGGWVDGGLPARPGRRSCRGGLSSSWIPQSPDRWRRLWRI
ncbi:MAG: hypothetical protein ACO2PN_23460 [Pyrobaculum sp.]